MELERPYIQGFSNRNEQAQSFDVTVHHKDCATAARWTYNYFSLYTVQYKWSDFAGNHTYSITPRS
jgi:hypothetical protein